jgi:deazaflavin-dependent oxidoreductase (nitroreductase family)
VSERYWHDAPMPSLPSSTTLFVNALRIHQAVYEGTRGLIGHRILLGMPALMLRTTGRKSGLTRTNALVYGKDGDRLMVVASNGGHRRPPAWLLNLEANPDVEVQVGVRRWPGPPSRCAPATRTTTGSSPSATGPTAASSRRTRR